MDNQSRVGAPISRPTLLRAAAALLPRSMEGQQNIKVRCSYEPQ